MVSVVLNTYNAEKYLEPVLESVKDFDEIVVCDMESTDNTIAIAERFGCKIVTFPKGNITICEPARNTAIQSASNEWVLVIDADEIVTPELREHLYNLAADPNSADAYFIARLNGVLDGYDLSSYPDYQCRFLKKSKTDWPATIHAKPVIDGRVDYLPKDRKELAFRHYPEPMSKRFMKICTYTDNEVPRRKRKKVTMLSLVTEPFFRFFKSYILKGGIMHGKIGYIRAQEACFYRFMLLCKLYEEQLKESK